VATRDFPECEWTARGLRPVARWVQRLEPDGVRLVMEWSVPDPEPQDATRSVTTA
jgi:hypothetical protein